MEKNKKPDKRSTDWLKTLKKMKVDPSRLSLKELSAFRDFDLYLNKPINGPVQFQYLLKSFRALTSFALTAIFTKSSDSLSRCWEELDRLFMNETIFDDDVFVQSWIFCDFPYGPENQTALDYFEIFLKESGLVENYQYFIDQMRKSRLGLYQEIISSKKTIKFQELFTGNIVNIDRSIENYEKGEIFLTRLIEIEGEIYMFGDPKCWPKEYKLNLENMVKAKLFYFDAANIEKQYERFMKFAGPYWMSCVVQDQNCPILEPDHYLKYRR
jgi:hypothetical protein